MSKFYNVQPFDRWREGSLLSGQWIYDQTTQTGLSELFDYGLELNLRLEKEWSIRHDPNSPFRPSRPWVWAPGDRPLCGSEFINSKPLSLSEMGR